MNATTPDPTAAQTASKPPAALQSADWRAYLREGVATVLAVAIASIALMMLWNVFVSAGVPTDAAGTTIVDEAFAAPYLAANERQKDIMTYGLSLLSAVMGYYFGRVPAERRAEKAEANADKSQETANNAQSAASQAEVEKSKATQRIAQTRAAMRDIQAKLAAAQPGQRKALGASAGASPSADEQIVAASASIDTLLSTLE